MDAEFETELKSVLIGATRSQNLKFSKLRFWLLLVSIVTITLQSRWPLCRCNTAVVAANVKPIDVISDRRNPSFFGLQLQM